MFKLLLKFMFSRRALEELYERRKALHPSEQNRTAVTLLACGTLFLLIMSFLMTMSWSRKNIDKFIDSQPSIEILPDQKWAWSKPFQSSCNNLGTCLVEAKNSEVISGELNSIEPLIEGKTDTPWYAFLETEATINITKLFFSDRKITFTLPQFRYHKAHVFMNRNLVGVYNSSERIAINYDRVLDTKISSEVIHFEVLLQAPSDIDSLRPIGINQQHPFENQISYMPSHVYAKYKQFVAAESAGRGDFIGYIARIVMAVFVLALFLLVDGSPETMGLGLFMGFEAFAMSLSFDWFQLPYQEWIRHYCYQMGDFFRLFFFLQLARVIDRKVMWWLLVTSALSIPYGYLRYHQVDLGIDWPAKIPKYRDMIIGIIGTAVCLRAAFYLLNKNLPWRVIALSVAGLASFEHCFQPIGSLIPAVADSSLFQSYVDIFQPLSAYLLAFSAFINISTLENRVKSLSKIEAKHREIQHEMELGQTVQQAFLHLPELPAKIDFVTFHEAMLYVSGDTYFVDWNENEDQLTFLINDVTGHGVQAALKASGVNVIANTMWLNSSTDSTKNKIEEYASVVNRFFKRMDENPDVLAMGAVQVDFRRGLASFYRVNFPFPIMIEPKTSHVEGESSRKNDNWRIRLMVIANETLTHFQLTKGSFIIVFSDGFMDTSRSTNEFLNYLRKHVSRADFNLTGEDIKKLIVECPIKSSNVDDRTMNIFQWTLSEQDKKTIIDQRESENLPNKSTRAA